MVAGISGAMPGSGADVGVEDDSEGRLKLPHPPRKIVSAEAIPRLATVRTLSDLTMVFPRANWWPLPSAAKRKTAVGAMTSRKLRRRSDLVSPSMLYRPHQRIKSPWLDRIGVKPYSRAHN